VSLQHWAAAALLRGAAGLAEGRPACIDDPAIARLRAMIHATADPALADDAAEVTLELRDGRLLRHQIVHASGSAASSSGLAALEAKFHAQAGWLPSGRAAALIAQCWALDELPDMAVLARLAA
jgi:2-methylcitrate dehydratase PrpD